MSDKKIDADVLYLFEIAKGIVFSTKVATTTFADMVSEAAANIGEPTSERLPNGKIPLRRQLKEALNLIEILEKKDFDTEDTTEESTENDDLDYVEIDEDK